MFVHRGSPFRVLWRLTLRSFPDGLPHLSNCYCLPGRAGGSPHGLAVLPEPGATFSEDLDLSNLYDLSRPGKYAIQVSRLDLESKTEVRSNTITVTVEEASEYDQRFAQATAPFLLAITVPKDTVKSGSDIPLRMYA